MRINKGKPANEVVQKTIVSCALRIYLSIVTTNLRGIISKD